MASQSIDDDGYWKIQLRYSPGMGASASYMSPRKKQRKRSGKSTPQRQAAPPVGESELPAARSRTNRWLLGLLALVIGALLVYQGPLRRQYGLMSVRRLVAARQLSEARTRLLAMVERDSHPDTLLWLARVHRKLGRMSEARDAIEQAFANGALQERLELEQALALAQSGQISKAEATLMRALEEAPEETAEICEALVSGYMRNYRFGEAARWIEAWKQDYAADPQPHIAQGKLWQHLRLWNEAAEAFGEARRRAPQRTDILSGLGESLAALHRYDDAVEVYREAVALEPDNPTILAGLAGCYLAQGLTDPAAPLYRQLLEQDEDSFEAHFGLGRIALDSGDAATALGHLEPLEARQPRNTSLRFSLGSALRAAGRADEVQKHFEFVEQATVAREQIQKLTRSIQTQPDAVEPRVEVAKLLMDYGSLAEAAAWLISAVELEPGHAEANRLLADYYEQTGNASRAADHRRAGARAADNGK
ncbi:MAG: tetratricopeptide repeat protein [Planctomycetales bacterium]|nr:tetratricopeptide repeat protein [Planctomycetales bacterium]